MYRQVLLVEDDPVLRRIVERNLAACGVAVQTAPSAEEAVRRALAERPDLLLLDLALPDRSGWDVLRALQAHGVDIPTIVLTGARVGPRHRAEFHPVAYLPKPFPPEALLRLVCGPQAVPAPLEPGDEEEDI